MWKVKTSVIARHMVNIWFHTGKAVYLLPHELFIIPGFYLLWKKDRSLFPAGFSSSGLSTCCLFHLDGWWYSGSFGMRALMGPMCLHPFPWQPWSPGSADAKPLYG